MESAIWGHPKNLLSQLSMQVRRRPTHEENAMEDGSGLVHAKRDPLRPLTLFIFGHVQPSQDRAIRLGQIELPESKNHIIYYIYPCYRNLN